MTAEARPLPRPFRPNVMAMAYTGPPYARQLAATPDNALPFVSATPLQLRLGRRHRLVLRLRKAVAGRHVAPDTGKRLCESLRRLGKLEESGRVASSLGWRRPDRPVAATKLCYADGFPRPRLSAPGHTL